MWYYDLLHDFKKPGPGFSLDLFVINRPESPVGPPQAI